MSVWLFHFDSTSMEFSLTRCSLFHVRGDSHPRPHAYAMYAGMITQLLHFLTSWDQVKFFSRIFDTPIIVEGLISIGQERDISYY